MDEGNCIGKNNQLPWGKIKYDMKYFKETTMFHTVIMGRKTFESLGHKPLKNRVNIVVSKHDAYYKHNYIQSNSTLIFLKSIEKTLAFCREGSENFIIGGKALYDEFWNTADRIYLTRIHKTYSDGDTFMQDIDETIYKEISRKFIQGSDREPDLTVSIYDRKYTTESQKEFLGCKS